MFNILGLAGWYHRFISNFATISSLLTDLLKRNQKLVWNEQAQHAFETVKTCDIGSVLFQRFDVGTEYAIAYYSHKLNPAQRKYSVTELECLSAVMSVKKFRPYVEGYAFTIITDHASLCWLMNERDLSGRLARWSLKLITKHSSGRALQN